jgi:hypothetical protein
MLDFIKNLRGKGSGSDVNSDPETDVVEAEVVETEGRYF